MPKNNPQAAYVPATRITNGFIELYLRSDYFSAAELVELLADRMHIPANSFKVETDVWMIAFTDAQMPGSAKQLLENAISAPPVNAAGFAWVGNNSQPQFPSGGNPDHLCDQADSTIRTTTEAPPHFWTELIPKHVNLVERYGEAPAVVVPGMKTYYQQPRAEEKQLGHCDGYSYATDRFVGGAFVSPDPVQLPPAKLDCPSLALVISTSAVFAPEEDLLKARSPDEFLTSVLARLHAPDSSGK